MNLASVIRLAISQLGRNKTRSLLTALGIIIGVGSVITMVSLGQGANKSVQDQISAMGTNLIMVMPGSAKGAHGGPAQGAGSIITMNADDAEAIETNCPSVRLACPVVRSNAQVIYSSQNWQTSIMGVGTSYLTIRTWNLDRGRFFTDIETRQGTKVCVLGKTVADNLFGDVDPVGRIIRIRKIPFRVVGLLASRGQTGMGQDQDDVILAPLATVQKRMLGITFVHMLMVSAAGDDKVNSAKDEIQPLLRHRHRLNAADDDDFHLRTQADLSQMAGQTLTILSLLLSSVAAVSLIVGGIGIMNIMLVSVTERTREIGIRMAIGARGRDILTQFLVEAMVLSSIGGVAGILLGSAGAHAVSRFAGWEPLVSTTAVVVAVLFSAGVGILFGLYPAWKASRLDPIEALRFE